MAPTMNPNPTTIIDHTAFPTLIDAFFKDPDLPTLLNLRSLSKEYRARFNRDLFKHVAVSGFRCQVHPNTGAYIGYVLELVPTISRKMTPLKKGSVLPLVPGAVEIMDIEYKGDHFDSLSKLGLSAVHTIHYTSYGGYRVPYDQLLRRSHQDGRFFGV